MYEKGRIILAKQNSVIIDPGHGGSDPGAVYGNRREKDDTLALAYDIGNALEQRGIRVEYTRIGDIYNSPYEKAEIGNRSAADLFLSIHRNAMPVPGTGSGTMSLIFGRGGDAETFARNINKELAKTGWKDLGISERPNLVVLRDTAFPAVLVEVGFIDNEKDRRCDRGWNRADVCGAGKADVRCGGTGILYGADRHLPGADQRGKGDGTAESSGIPCVHDF